MPRILIALLAVSALLAACAGSPATDPIGTDPGADATTPDATMPDDGGMNGDLSQDMLDDLLEQAAQETGVPVDEISVVTAESVTWSDGSIGCPEEGMGYTQALVPGYRVVLDVAGEQIHFHAGSDGQFFACDDPQEPIEGGTVDR
ncbi:MAG TPA: hypothetical protein VM253_11320 [Candidatus Limnocylindrales bacterium]|jgi:hypothetical protein|nr:hypothetical protein [Candidatus Limnocylindrales bacterium]